MLLLALLVGQIAAVPRINLSVSRFAAQYGAIRSMEESNEDPKTPGLKAAVDDLKALEQSFPNQIKTRSGVVVRAGDGGQAKVSALYWRTLDALTFSASSGDALSDIPTLMPKIGGELDASAAVKAIQKALDESRSEFEAKLWPEGQKEVEACIDSFERIPEAHRDSALRFILQTAGIATPPKRIDIRLVPRMAGPEGMTVRTSTGLLVVIGLGKFRGSDFAEVVLHEATHVFDTAAGSDSLFGKLRVALKAGNRSAFELEEVPHTVMFILAAEAVRRFIDPAHKDVGASFGIYSRGLEPIRRVEQPILMELAANRITADDAVRQIVSGLGSLDASIDSRGGGILQTDAPMEVLSTPCRRTF